MDKQMNLSVKDKKMEKRCKQSGKQFERWKANIISLLDKKNSIIFRENILLFLGFR